MERLERKRSIAEISATGNGSQVPVSNASGSFEMTNFNADALPYDSTHSVKIVLDEKQTMALSSAITIDGVAQTTVEGALNALNNKTVTYTVDDELSTTSENPVQNKVITVALNAKQMQTLSSAITIGGVSETTVESSLNALNDVKIEADDLANVAFSGAYTDITGTPTLGTASALDVATTGDATTSQVVKGDDSRLTDARPSSDVTNSYSASGIVPVSGTAVNAALETLDVTGESNIAASKTLASWSETDGKVSIATQDISITTSQISDFPTIPTVTDTYDGTSSDAMSGIAVKSAIDALDGTISGTPSTSKTLSALSQTDGKISATFSDISITKSQVSDFPNIDTTVTNGSTNLITSGAVFTAIDNLPEPMIFKGTLGTNGTITTLPTASTSNEGYTYKVITAGTYASIVCKIGDVVVSNGSEWVLIPAGDTDSDTWRNIKVNGTEKLTGAISSGAVDFIDGTNTSVAFDATGNKISVSVPTVSTSSAGVVPQGNTVTTQSQTTKFLREDGTWQTPSYTSYSDATTSDSGLMSATDKTKLDGIEEEATANIAYDSDPEMNGTASAGVSDDYARGDHVHPSDISKITKSTPAISNNSPYLFKKSGAVGLERLKDIVGASYVNNQLVDTNTTSVTIASGHKYVAKISGTLSVGQSSGSAISVTGGTDTFTDLTQLFGSASIADYIYSLETATAGAGIAKLKELGFDFSAYRAYDGGSIVSVKTSGLKVVGFNQWDEQWEIGTINTSTGQNTVGNGIRSKNYIPIVPNTEYYITFDNEHYGSNSYVMFYDANKNFVAARYILHSNPRNFTPFSNVCYVRFYLWGRVDSSTVYNNDICLNVSDVNRNGQYEPYTSKNTPLSLIDLRGLYKIDANNNIYADGDKYKPSGEVGRKWGLIDMGSLTWIYSSGFFYTTETTLKKLGSYNILCSKYLTSAVPLVADMGDKQIVGSNSSAYVYVKDSAYTDATTFKNSLNGVYLVYELATPTAETAKPYPEYINIYQGGTEEFIDTRALPAPVGHYSDLFEVNAESIIGTGSIKDGQGNVLSNKQDKFLSEPITVESTEYLTVETALNAINNKSGGGGTQIQSDWDQSDDTQVDYIKNKPTLGTASAKDVASSGDASSTEVVMGNDSRLTDARNAADVYDWAKAASKPTYTASEVGALASTTKYAGASTAGGAATSASKLTNTSAIGSETNPVYFTSGGVPSACTYSLNKTVPSDAVFTDTNTKVTSAANHYAPATASGSDVTASATGGTAAWSIDVVQGVTLNTDGKGHVTGMSVTSGKIPANPNTDTKVRQTLSTTNKNYPLLLSAAESSSTTANVDNVSYRANAIYANPSTGNIQATQLNGVTIGSAPKFTDTTYTATTTSIGSASAGTAIAADDITAWSAGTVPTLGTAIPADDITAWTTNTPTSASVANGTLTITAGSAASLSYTAKSIPNVTSVGTAPSLTYTARSIPNISVTATTVATGITAS